MTIQILFSKLTWTDGWWKKSRFIFLCVEAIIMANSKNDSPGNYQLFELVTAKWHLFYSYSKIMTNWKDRPKGSFTQMCTGQAFLSCFVNCLEARHCSLERYAKVWMFSTYCFELLGRSEKIRKVTDKMNKFLRNQQKNPTWTFFC